MRLAERTGSWRTRLVFPDRLAAGEYPASAAPVVRGSTVFFASQEQVRDGWRQHLERGADGGSGGGYSYGVYGTPTAVELGLRIAELEGARHTFVVPSGQASIALIYLAFCRPGCHVLLPWTAYGPSKELGAGLLAAWQVDVELYDPLVGGGIAALLRPETALVWCESPGSITMEVQDVPAIVAAAHARGVPVALDNTYSAGVLFDAFAHGVDVSMQALTKYVGGHGDVLLGSVSVGTEAAFERVGDVNRALGYSASPDECSLALRGLQTLAVRMDAIERSALELAQWFAERDEIAAVLHPALPGCGGHDVWARDFSGSASLFSVVFREGISQEQVNRFVNALRLFRIGWSWGGVNSLVMSYPGLERPGKPVGPIVRFHVGLEDVRELIADVEAALALI